MDKKVLIIGRSFHPDGKETADAIFQGLLPFFEDKPASLERAYLKDLLFDISNDRIAVIDSATGTDLKEYGAVLMTNWFSHASIRKDVAYTIALYLQHHGVTVFNSEAACSRSTSKLSQMIIAALNGIPIPRTLFSISYEVLSEYAQKDEPIGQPFILKDAQASRGKGNYLIKSYEELQRYAAEHTEKTPFMIQSYVTSDHSDYRYFVTGGKIAFVIHRLGSEESHLHNTSKGAQSELLEVGGMRPEISELVERFAVLIHREVTGIDIILDKNTDDCYLLEANPIPQIATGAFVDRKLQALADALATAAQKGAKS